MIIMLLGALFAGFTTGFAGFGTGLVASGFWFYALPASAVPPLVALVSVAGQLVGLVMLRASFNLRRAWPFLAGGALGVPLGVHLLSLASPTMLRTAVGVFLVFYSLWRLLSAGASAWAARRGTLSDGIVGAGGGILGGFAGLSGPLPLVWLELKGVERHARRAIYQPFNLIVLALASAAMGIEGQITVEVLRAAILCIPVTILAAWVGARAYIGVSAATFERAVLFLLLTSGGILLWQAISNTG